MLLRSVTGESFNGISHDLYGWNWGHNRLTCCLQCGPILDDGKGPYESLVVPSTDVAIAARVLPESSCGNSPVALIVYLPRAFGDAAASKAMV